MKNKFTQVDIQSIYKVQPSKGWAVMDCKNCGKEFRYRKYNVWTKYCTRDCYSKALLWQKELKKNLQH